MKKFLIKITLFIMFIISLFIGYQGYVYYDINQKNTGIGKITVDLPPFYSIGINDTMLASYLLKTGFFQFDKNLTYDGVFNKNWLPLSYNFCNTKLGGDYYTIIDDFDKDGLPGIIDKHPFDYSNGDARIRNSITDDFSGDGIPNALSMDADGNGILDVYQAICFNGVNEKGIEQRKGFWGNDGNEFVINKDTYINKIRELLENQIPNKEILDIDAFNQGIEYVYNRLMYVEDIIYSIDGKNYYINRKDLLSQ